MDFSTGSVGIGAVAPNFAALVEEYSRSHFDRAASPDAAAAGRRYISLVGDAELDEGSVWEAIAEPCMSGLRNVLWVVDLNRQSLDRIIPGIRVQVWREMFAANGWTVVDAKYGTRLQAAFEESGGDLLRGSIDGMSNELYQRLLRLAPAELREWLPRTSGDPEGLRRFIGRWTDQALQDVFRNLGGHDFATLREALTTADRADGPSVVLAYTLKGWRLPTVGDPQNHSATLSDEQMEGLRTDLGIPPEQTWTGLAPGTPEARLCLEVRQQLGEAGPSANRVESPGGASGDGAIAVPEGLEASYRGRLSTQQILGRILTGIARQLPELSKRVVTVNPDVASSTNLGGWINRVGVWSRGDVASLPDEGGDGALTWEESPQGQHIELGISENDLFMMLGQLGLSRELVGETLFPIGTLYDPFVRRGLDALFYSVYTGGRFIFVGTPSGTTLGPEGGAHQSVITPSIGVELPDVAYYEPCFGQELEWVLFSALERIRIRRECTYLRLTTKKVDQGLFPRPASPADLARRRRQVLEGAYRLADRSAAPGYRPGQNVVHIFASGALVPEAIRAAAGLEGEGVFANVINVTGPGTLYGRYQAHVRAAVDGTRETPEFLSEIVPADERSASIVTVVDGHPHTLAWLGGALSAKTLALGVTEFGQSGSPDDLYREYRIDATSIMGACFSALGS